MKIRRRTLLTIVSVALAALAWLGLASGRALLYAQDSHTGEAHGSHSDAREVAPHDTEGDQGREPEDAQGDHEGHDHPDRGEDEPEPALEHEADDEHGPEAEGAHGDDDEHGRAERAGPSVRLSEEQMRQFGIELAVAAPGHIERKVKLPGEIVINADRAAHIVPRAPGIAREVRVHIGDAVEAGQVLAVIESAELGEAQSDYLVQLNEISCCTIDLARAEALHESLTKLLALLDESPTLDDLLKAEFTEMGEGHGELVAAYAELVFARSAYEREERLVREQASSQADFEAAESAFKKAYAQYIAMRGAVAFETRRTMLEAQRARQNAELAVKTAERKLRVLGLSDHDVEDLQAIIKGGAHECGPDCTDPECARENASGDGHDDLVSRLGQYALRAPFDGVVIEKHITLGERLGEDADLFTVADMSTVWVDLSVYQKDLPHVQAGQTFHIEPGEGVPGAEGRLAYVFPLVDQHTRTCTARAVLPNPDGRLRPGLFVSADVHVGDGVAAVLVPKGALQRLEDRTVVFVPEEGALVSRPVEVGRSSRTHVEVLSGLAAGERYVARGAFDLKAKIVTGGLGAHAGHGH